VEEEKDTTGLSNKQLTLNKFAKSLARNG
jgi:hypothetical protein